MFDSRALSRVQSLILVFVVVVAGLGGGVAYIVLSGGQRSAEPIRIGLCADLDLGGRDAWQGAVLAAEQVNGEGGVLGRLFEIVAEDDDSGTPPYDIEFMMNALTRLITVDKADFVLCQTGIPLIAQDFCADHKVIQFAHVVEDELTQRVADDYDRYKGFFRAGTGNMTTGINGLADSALTLRNYTGFNKIAFLALDRPIAKELYSAMADKLQDQGFEIVYENTFSADTFDFSSYFAAIEATGAEILYANVGMASVPFVKEYHDRQAPCIVWGNIAMAEDSDYWEATDGKCEFVSFTGFPVVSGFPLTSKTVPMREAYIERWGEVPGVRSASAYDLVRFILPDAIKRAGSIDFEAVIAALEATEVETTLARRFVYTSTHDIMHGGAGLNRPSEDYLVVCLFQWQDGRQVPVYPKQIMEEIGATYKFPPWSGPWDKK